MNEMRPLLSPLFVPADRPDRFEKAAATGADAIIVDLEDAVAPANKQAARHNLRSLAGIATPTFVRINPETTDWFEDDLEALGAFGLHNILLPKVEDVGSLDLVEKVLGREANMVATIETARGVLNAREIARHRSVRQLAFGTADYALDLGITPNPDALSIALTMLVIASRAEDKPAPLDGPTFDLSDSGALTADVQRAARLGAGGKLCIHPKQIETVRRGFAPSSEEIAWARSIVDAGNGTGAARAGDQFADKPIVERARLILQRAGQS
jgi:citrate lyase subunit beta/citryl-CoA lyase